MSKKNMSKKIEFKEIVTERKMLISKIVSGKEKDLEELESISEDLSLKLAETLRVDDGVTSEAGVVAEILNSFFLSICELLPLSSIFFLSNFERGELTWALQELIEAGMLHRERDRVYGINIEFLNGKLKEIL